MEGCLLAQRKSGKALIAIALTGDTLCSMREYRYWDGRLKSTRTFASLKKKRENLLSVSVSARKSKETDDTVKLVFLCHIDRGTVCGVRNRYSCLLVARFTEF